MKTTWVWVCHAFLPTDRGSKGTAALLSTASNVTWASSIGLQYPKLFKANYNVANSAKIRTVSSPQVWPLQNIYRRGKSVIRTLRWVVSI